MRIEASALALAVLLLLAGCTSVPPAPTADDAAATALRRFTLDAKVAWQRPERSGRAAVEWIQDGERARLLVTGPFGAGAALLESTPGRARLTVGDDVRSAPDAGDLLADVLDIPLPVTRARWWVRGLPAPGAVESVVRDADGRAVRIDQAGWQVRIDRWTAIDGVALPARLHLSRGELSLLLVATRWQPGVARWPARD